MYLTMLYLLVVNAFKGVGCIITLQSKPPPTQFVYQLTMSSFSKFTCSTFKDMMSKFGKEGFSFKHYKHLYYIFVKVCNLDLEINLFIYVLTVNFNEIELILEEGILIHSYRPRKILPSHGCSQYLQSIVI